MKKRETIRNVVATANQKPMETGGLNKKAEPEYGDREKSAEMQLGSTLVLRFISGVQEQEKIGFGMDKCWMA